MVLNDACMRFFCFNNAKMKHLKNILLEKDLVSYRFIDFKLFHPEQRNFYQNDTRFLDTGEFLVLYQDFDISNRAFFNLIHACPLPQTMLKDNNWYFRVFN